MCNLRFSPPPPPQPKWEILGAHPVLQTHRYPFHKYQAIAGSYIYRGADTSLARPGRKQATATEDFDVHLSYL